MQVGAAALELDLRGVAAAVVVVTHMERLVDVLGEMDEKEERVLALAPGRLAIGEDLAVMLDLRHNATTRIAVAGLEVARRQRDVDVVPMAAPRVDVVALI